MTLGMIVALVCVFVSTSVILAFSSLYLHGPAAVGAGERPRTADRVFATYSRSFGEIATVQTPVAIAINASGWVYLQDEGAQRIRVFNPDGDFAFQFSAGFARGLAINASTGHVYVLLAASVQVYTASGQWVTGWGSHGSGDSQFDDPLALAINGSGYVYVSDTCNYRIQAFSPLGGYITQWGSYGKTQEDQFQSAYGIAINVTGHVYIADGGNNSVKVFTATGQFISRWGGELGSGAGEFNYNRAIAVNASGYVNVVEDGNNRVQVFDQVGQYVRMWGSQGNDPGQFLQPMGIATNASGAVFVVDPDNSRVQVFDQCGSLVGNLGKSAADPGCLKGAEGVAVNTTGAIYVADCLNNRVQVFSPEGDYLFNWYVLHPKALAINGSNCVYISGSTPSAPAEVFTPTGTRLYTFGNGILSGANNDFAINASGCVFVTGVASVSVFGPDGAYLYTFGSGGTGVDQFTPNLMGIAFDSSGYLHVTNNYRVKVFTRDGTYIRCYARDLSNSNGGFSDTLGRVRVDAAGVAYVVDTGASRVSAFAPYGSLAGEWGNGGDGDGQFTTPQGIVINSSSHMFVADSARVQLFSTIRISRPARPVITHISLNKTTSQISLRWNSVAGAISYRIYRSLDLTTSDLDDFTLVNNTTNMLATDARSGSGTYRYVVTAWNGYEESEPSEAKTIYAPPDNDWTPVVVGSSAGGAAVMGVLVFWRKNKKARS